MQVEQCSEHVARLCSSTGAVLAWLHYAPNGWADDGFCPVFSNATAMVGAARPMSEISYGPCSGLDALFRADFLACAGAVCSPDVARDIQAWAQESLGIVIKSSNICDLLAEIQLAIVPLKVPTVTCADDYSLVHALNRTVRLAHRPQAIARLGEIAETDASVSSIHAAFVGAYQRLPTSERASFSVYMKADTRLAAVNTDTFDTASTFRLMRAFSRIQHMNQQNKTKKEKV